MMGMMNQMGDPNRQTDFRQDPRAMMLAMARQGMDPMAMMRKKMIMPSMSQGIQEMPNALARKLMLMRQGGLR